ncbi:MAG: hypothetical protein U9P07_00540 [Pseudomonadota bacterium]|nr:hypothetical protein [Pseudomonadota bacterium]
MGENKTYESDALNPRYVFQAIEHELLMEIATGEVNAQKVACKVLASRGFGSTGKWVGFAQAKKEWGVS